MSIHSTYELEYEVMRSSNEMLQNYSSVPTFPHHMFGHINAHKIFISTHELQHNIPAASCRNATATMQIPTVFHVW